MSTSPHCVGAFVDVAKLKAAAARGRRGEKRVKTSVESNIMDMLRSTKG
jgi:hypothetical protein